MSPSIVLVHGGFVDGAGWRGVYDALRGDGYAVRIVLEGYRRRSRNFESGLCSGESGCLVMRRGRLWQ